MAAKNNYVDRKWELAKEYWFQNSYKYWDAYLDSLLEKSDDKLEWYDKAMLNVNPDLAAKRAAYQKSLAKSNKLQSDLTNIQSAQQFLQNNVSQQKDRINKLYDLQDKAAAISASIQWTNRVAGWLWAASNVLNNSRWITEATKHQQILQNDAQRESALANVAQQEANLPSVLASLEQSKASIDQANANAELARAQAKYYNSQATKWSWWWISSNKKNNNNNNNEESEVKVVWDWDLHWYKYEWWQLKDSNGNVIYSWWLLEYNWNLYNEDWTKLIYDKDANKWYWLTVPKVNIPDTTSLTWKRMPAWTTIPTLKKEMWTWSNITFTNVGNRVSL